MAALSGSIKTKRIVVKETIATTGYNETIWSKELDAARNPCKHEQVLSYLIISASIML